MKSRLLKRRHGAVLGLAFVVAVGCRHAGTTSAPAPKPPAFPVGELGHFYQANALIESDRDKEAAALLAPLLEKVGRAPAVLANLAITKLAESDNEAAVTLATEAHEAATDSAEVDLILAASLNASGKTGEAESLLAESYAEHPEDVRVCWALIEARALVGGDAGDQTLEPYESLLQLAPTNLAALLGAARAAIDAGDVSRAGKWLLRAMAQIPEPPSGLQPLLDSLDKAVADKDGAKLASIAARTRNVMLATDRYRADVLALGASTDQKPDPVRHPIWKLSGKREAATKAEIRFEPAVAGELLPERTDGAPLQRIVVGTMAEDRSPALLTIDKAGRGRLLAFDSGKYIDKTDAVGLSQLPPCRNGLFVDLNNDKRMDLLISSDEGDRYFRQNESGKFEDVTDEIGLAGAPPSNGAQPFDYDNDGDLDLLRWDDQRLYLHQNDGEGHLVNVESRPGLPMEIADIQSIRTLDLDDDGDIDMFITYGIGPYKIRIVSNERLASFRDVTDLLPPVWTKFFAPPEIADFNNDGRLELVAVGLGNRFSFSPSFELRKLGLIKTMRTTWAMVIADFDNDGRLDRVDIGEFGETIYENVGFLPGVDVMAVDLDRDGRVDLLSSAGDAYLNKTQNAGNWLRVALVGLNTGDSRFNAFGLGSTIEIRCGPLYQKRPVVMPTTHFGLGPYGQADVMRVVWPNGNYQSLEYRADSKIALAGNRQIVETQTLKGSCPYLYAWNGERFEFVTDVLWRSALGMSIMQGVYGHHGTADDYFKIDGDRLAVTEGAYRLSFTEELWETSYFDYCRLLVVDHPAGGDIYVDEKCLTPPYPPFEILKVARRRVPVSATDERGRDLLPLLKAPDGRYVGDFTPTRYQGLVELHDLILDLGDIDDDEPVRLFLQGWLWPTDASTNVAVSQNPTLGPQAPTLQVIDANGEWADSDRVVGFPSGKSKTIAIDLTRAFSTDDHRVRIRTNFCVYWDAAFFTVGAQDVETRVTELAVDRARLRERGISYQYAAHPGGPRIPDYDAIDPDAQWRDQVGDYTPLGDVTRSLAAVDDEYVIVGAGDEVQMWFDARAAPALPEGWVRDFVIHTDGWLKDGDLNSASGKTVGPLPWHGMPGYPMGAVRTNAAERRIEEGRHRDQSAFRDHLRP